MEKILPAIVAALLATTSNIAMAQSGGSGPSSPIIVEPMPTTSVAAIEYDDDDAMTIQIEDDDDDDEDDDEDLDDDEM